LHGKNCGKVFLIVPYSTYDEITKLEVIRIEKRAKHSAFPNNEFRQLYLAHKSRPPLTGNLLSFG
ncbi:MAG TPA: hypothetical protein VGC95_13065, partial [Chitinophagaceae bacterium]